jgi:hypothetical protein
MRSGYAIGRGPMLMKTPSHRQQAVRRRLVVVCGVLALALVSGLVGAMTHPASGAAPAAQPAMGPFSYFPSE